MGKEGTHLSLQLGFSSSPFDAQQNTQAERARSHTGGYRVPRLLTWGEGDPTDPERAAGSSSQINRSGGCAPVLQVFKDLLVWHLHLLVHPSSTRHGFTQKESQYSSSCSAGAALPKAFICSGCLCQHTHKRSPSAPVSK